MEDYVTFKQAVKLKELGFDWKVYQYYKIDVEGDINFWFPEEGAYDFNSFDDGRYSAPTLYQANKWLIEKFSMQVHTRLYEVVGKSEVRKWRYHLTHSGLCMVGGWDYFDKYEQVLSAGIDRALEIIL